MAQKATKKGMFTAASNKVLIGLFICDRPREECGVIGAENMCKVQLRFFELN